MKVFGVERKHCEYKSCKNKAEFLMIEPITKGCNTHVYCKKHKKQAEAEI
jgi:hypothetical protein